MSSKWETKSLHMSNKFEDKLKLPPVPSETFFLTYESEVKDNIHPDTRKNVILPFANSDLYLAPITEARLLTPLGDQNVKRTFEITFSVEKGNFKFKPGDTIGLLPANSEAEVSKLLGLLELEDKEDLTYRIVKNDSTKKPPNHVPESSTLRYLFTHCLDIRSLIKKVFLYALSLHTSSKSEKRCLEILCSKEGSSVYTELILNKKINLTDVLEMFPSCKPPTNVVIQHLPRLTPRPYSIVNSQLANENIIKICFSIVEIDKYQTGIATGFLEKLISTKKIKYMSNRDKTEEDSDTILKSIENHMNILSMEDIIHISSINEYPKVPIYLRKGNGFTLPDDNSVPLLMIGPGTGIAPFLGFLEERQHMKKLHPDKAFGDTWLFFGCRHPQKDFIYKDRLDIYLEDGTLSTLTTSFSRSSDHKREYVQDKIVENGKKIVSFIESGAVIYVCGDIASMASDVMAAIVKCFVTYKSMTQEEAHKVVEDLQKTKRYLLDIWS